jgi:RNA polymerase sigma-70 factor (sigma-E family)
MGEVAAVIDRTGFEDFVRAHSPALHRTAYLLTGSDYSAEELLQDTFSELYGKWHRVSAVDLPVAYVRRAMTNRFVSGRRRHSSRDISVWEVPDRWSDTDLSDQVATRSALWQLLGTLSPSQRAAVVLRYFNDLPDEQIAEMLGCRPATVRSLIRRAVTTLRAAYPDRFTFLIGLEGLR